MHKYNIVVLGVALYLLTGCIEQYYPDEGELKTGTMVVMAQLTTGPGVQSIYISRSSTILYPEYDPVSDCHVEIEAVNGNTMEFKESAPGTYSGFFEEDFLVSGEDYRIIFITQEGKQYESEYEKIFPVSEIDSVYYVREDHPTRDPEITEEGVQFFIDFAIEKDSARYLRWKLTETYEIRNPENEAWIFDVDRILKEMPDSSSWFTCWITLELPDIYTLDLGNVDGEHFREMPLNYVSTDTRRLHYRYSLLVQQISLSKDAFRYWDELGKNLQEKGNLFDVQPSILPGNICSVSDDEELVIGFFGISDVTEKRIFVEDVPGLKIYKNPAYCAPGEFPPYLYRRPLYMLPIYMSRGRYDGELKFGQVNKYCVDCRDYKGSTHIQPDFW